MIIYNFTIYCNMYSDLGKHKISEMPEHHVNPCVVVTMLLIYQNCPTFVLYFLVFSTLRLSKASEKHDQWNVCRSDILCFYIWS